MRDKERRMREKKLSVSCAERGGGGVHERDLFSWAAYVMPSITVTSNTRKSRICTTDCHSLHPSVI